jgi:molybdopterin molybdotransferase
MDGFALVTGSNVLAAGTRLTVTGSSLAGHPFAGSLRAGQAIRIMTGAVVPPGADAVVPVENTSGFEGAEVTLNSAVKRGDNIRPQGSEVTPGALLLPEGRRIAAAEVGALAVLGLTSVPVRKQPVVAILATGDEVVPVEATPQPHQVRESNSWALAAQVREAGGLALRLGIAPDDQDVLQEQLATALDRADLVLTIGGVSAGTHDLVTGALAQLQVHEVFHGVQLKPGKPTFFGTVSGRRAGFVFGLPGNPASSFTVFDLLVAPLLRRLLGLSALPMRTEAAPGGSAWKANRRLQAVPAMLEVLSGGLLQATLGKPSPSGDPFSLLGCDCYALLPPDTASSDMQVAVVVPASCGWPRS